MLDLTPDDKKYLANLGNHRIQEILERNQQKLWKECAYAPKEQIQLKQGASRLIDELLDSIKKVRK